VSGEGRLRGPGHRASLSLTGRLLDGGDDARIAIELERTAGGALGVGVAVSDLELGAAAPVLRTFLPGSELAGRSDVSIRIDRPQAEVWRVAARAEGRGCEGALPRMGDGHPVPVAVSAFEAGVDVDLDPERLRVERAFVSAEDSEIELSAEVERPLRPKASTVGRIGLDHYDLSRRDDLIAFLPPRQIAKLQSALSNLRSGRVENVRIEGQAPLRDWLRAFDDGQRGLLPDSVEARARFADFAVRAGEDETLTDLTGDVTWRGDRLELRGVRGRRAGHWLPLLDATFTGVSHLAANRSLPEIPDADDAPVMLGLGPMYDIVVDPNKPRGEMPKALMLALDHVVHPTLIWPLRNVFARAHPDEDGIRLLVEHAVWGRVPVRAEGIWAMQQTGPRRVEHVAIRVDVKPPIDGLPPLDRTDPIWARGRWDLDAHHLGNWNVVKSTGTFEAEGQDVRLLAYDLDLGIAGHALGEAVIDFSGPVELPYRTAVRVAGAKAQGVVDKIGFEPHEATGEVEMEGDLHGELRPGRRVMAGMEGTLHVHARDGEILKRLPVLLAMAKVTDTFNPFGSRNEMHYSEIDAMLRLERGTVHADELRITGRDLRMLASGQVDALDPEHPVEAVVGIFFFKALDRVIGVVPVLSGLILGDDDNLVGAYVQLTGPWESPDAGLVPLKTVASGPASIAIEGVPRFVKRAISAIQSAFSRPEVSAPPPSGEDS
ncbi:MAG TPA: AsmA-like C-terminal region-containing protein, partial [Myxococcota bacterium]|nr:AsmA-like C-terminal region-containing protein [Myxococcota bacterium]